MNIIQVLLVGGLIYIAMNQKTGQNRNLILVITGLLAFCMIGKEGLQVMEPAVQDSCTSTLVASPNTVTPSDDNNCTVVGTGATGSCTAVDDTITCAYVQGSVGTPVRPGLTTDFSELVAGCDNNTVIGALGCSEIPAVPAALLQTSYANRCRLNKTTNTMMPVGLVECDGSMSVMDGEGLKTDGSNQCNENILGWVSTCRCDPDTSTGVWPNCTAISTSA